MDMMELLRTRRSYRRFEQKPVPDALRQTILEAARLASSALNAQPIKYVVISQPEPLAAVMASVHWAAALPPKYGVPTPEQWPDFFVAVLEDTSIRKGCDTDAGLAIANMTMAAWAEGVGSCIMQNMDRPALCKLMGLPEQLVLHSMVAFGYPAHKSRIVEVEKGSVQYYLDQNRDYCVPKRSLSELVLKQL